jgi:hypothetical protein
MNKSVQRFLRPKTPGFHRNAKMQEVEEVKIIDPNIEQLINKEEYEKN